MDITHLENPLINGEISPEHDFITEEQSVIDNFSYKNNIKKICFYHYHVNGDCWSTRLIVKHIIENTTHLNLEYYYNAPRSLGSHCEDLGIKPENFNKLNIPNRIKDTYGIKDTIYSDNTIFINVWIGYSENLCCLCLKNINNRYNDIINDINNNTNFNIKFIEKNNDNIVPFNYSFYNVTFLRKYMEEQKQTYKKIILIMNLSVTTTIKLNEINHDNYLHYFSSKYPEYLFITFNKIGNNNNNIISMNDINEENKIELPLSHYGINFSYLSTLCDKLICLSTGPGLYCLNEENKYIKNKVILIDSITCIAAKCINNEEFMCTHKYDYYFKRYYYSSNDDLILELENFINL